MKRTFDQFDSDKSGAISVGTVNTILKMMGMHVSSAALEVEMNSFFIYKLELQPLKMSELNSFGNLLEVLTFNLGNNRRNR